MDVKHLTPSAMTWEWADGDEMRLTLNFGLLYLLKGRHKAQYERFFKALNNIGKPSSDQIFDALDIIYTAYLCQQLKCEQMDEALSYEEWLSVIPQDITAAMQTASKLISPKKAAASEAPSNGTATGAGDE